ncbi:hypothetical protein B484DRAFT_337362, partial [Ochromonadaceae sp. CCMP2298]
HIAYSIQHTAYSIQHTAYSIQHTAYSILHTAYSILHTTHCTLSEYSIQWAINTIDTLNTTTIPVPTYALHDGLHRVPRQEESVIAHTRYQEVERYLYHW